MENKRCIGIDLGTTYSYVVLLTGDGRSTDVMTGHPLAGDCAVLPDGTRTPIHRDRGIPTVIGYSKDTKTWLAGYELKKAMQENKDVVVETELKKKLREMARDGVKYGEGPKVSSIDTACGWITNGIWPPIWPSSSFTCFSTNRIP